MLRSPTNNNKDSHPLINNNKNIQKTAAKQLLSYYGVIKVPNISNSIIFSPPIVDIRSHESKCITRNK